MYIYIHTYIYIYVVSGLTKVASPQPPTSNGTAALFPKRWSSTMIRRRFWKAAIAQGFPEATSPQLQAPWALEVAMVEATSSLPPHLNCGPWATLLWKHINHCMGPCKAEQERLVSPRDLHATIVQFTLVKIYVFWQKARFVVGDLLAIGT